MTEPDPATQLAMVAAQIKKALDDLNAFIEASKTADDGVNDDGG